MKFVLIEMYGFFLMFGYIFDVLKWVSKQFFFYLLSVTTQCCIYNLWKFNTTNIGFQEIILILNTWNKNTKTELALVTLN